MRTTAILLVCGIGLLIAAGTVPVAGEEAMFDGDYVFHKYCSGCHGKNGQGIELFGIPLRGDPYVTAGKPEIIAQTIQMGRKYRDKLHREYSGMPKFQYIRAGEIDALIAYLKGPLQEASSEPARQDD
jgi:mono/diheme cytochrome c family protein